MTVAQIVRRGLAPADITVTFRPRRNFHPAPVVVREVSVTVAVAAAHEDAGGRGQGAALGRQAHLRRTEAHLRGPRGAPERGGAPRATQALVRVVLGVLAAVADHRAEDVRRVRSGIDGACRVGSRFWGRRKWE